MLEARRKAGKGKSTVHGTERIDNNHLFIGGVDTTELAREYGTPLYVYDVALIREKIQAYQSAFRQQEPLVWQIAYASKAFSTIAMIQLINEYGLSLDVVSGGELYTALKAGFPAGQIHFHGNNKSDDELNMAIDAGVGAVIVDNFYELERLERFCAEKERTMSILLRVTPGVTAHTHEFIMTGHDDTKFGFNLDNGMADRAVRLAAAAKQLKLIGIHFHIGSQMFETEGFARAVQIVYDYAENWRDRFGYEMRVLNVGGGFGIRYTAGDHPLPATVYIDRIVAAVRRESGRRNLPMPAVWIEPGRSIIGEAGTTLYTLGSVKDIPGVRKYVSVDGGMTDNIRPALYGARYEAMSASRADETADDPVTIAGKCCESGDVLIKESLLPHSSRPGDVLAVFCTGAYGYSMANHYNRLPNPAAIFVENGQADVVVRRETYDDLIRNDLLIREYSPRK